METKKYHDGKLMKLWLSDVFVDTSYASSVVRHNEWHPSDLFLELRMNNSNINLTRKHIYNLKKIVDASILELEKGNSKEVEKE